MISVHFQGKPLNITVIQVYAPTSNTEEAEVEWFYEDLQDLLELTPKKDVLFIIGKVKERKKVKSLSRVRLFATPWTIAYYAPLSMGFSRQEYWTGMPFSSPEDLPNPGVEPGSPTLQADSLPAELPGHPMDTEWVANK